MPDIKVRSLYDVSTTHAGRRRFRGATHRTHQAATRRRPDAADAPTEAKQRARFGDEMMIHRPTRQSGTAREDGWVARARLPSVSAFSLLGLSTTIYPPSGTELPRGLEALVGCGRQAVSSATLAWAARTV
jgi:hypothetical protein